MLGKILMLALYVAVVTADKAGYHYGGNWCYNWMHKFVPVREPKRFCGSNRYRWTDAKKKCADVNLQLCYSTEVCPHRHNTFTDFKLMPFWDLEFLPVADDVDYWMNTYVGTSHDICELVINPTNGMVESQMNYKEDFYCCPKCNLKRFWIGHHFTWQEANDFCQRQTMREKWEHRNEVQRKIVEDDPYQMHLCSSVQVCRGDTPRWMQEADGSEHWMPVSDSPNEWTMVADGESDSCLKYTEKYGGNKPAWGTDNTCEYEWKGFVDCCGIRPRHSGKLAILADEAGEVGSPQPDQNSGKYADEDEFVSLEDFNQQQANSDRIYMSETPSRGEGRANEVVDIPVPKYPSAENPASKE